MKVLLTGASGFIGKNFLEYAPKDMEIIGLYNRSTSLNEFVKEKKLRNVTLHKVDLLDEKQVQGLFKKIGKDIDCCLYLAANVDVPLSMNDPLHDLSQTAGSVITFLRNAGSIRRFVYLSSNAVYDGNKGIVTTKTPLNPHIPYCISKLAAEQYIRFYASRGKVKEHTIIRFGGAFGLHARPDKFMTKLMRELAVERKEEIEIYGDGTNIINLMYAKDTVTALLTALKSKRSNLTCILGQDNMTITQAVQRSANAIGRKVSIRYVPRISGQKYISFSVDSDFGRIFGLKPQYSFEQGVKEFAGLLTHEEKTKAK